MPRLRGVIFALIIVGFWLCPGLTSAAGGLETGFRQYRDRQGRSIQARVVRLDGDDVTIERTDGKQFTVSVTIFSPADQAHIRSLGSDNKPAALNLDGVWQGFAVEGRGEHPDRGPVHLELSIRDNRVVAKRLDGQALPINRGTLQIRAGQPVRLDGIATAASGRTQSYLGICELVGDTLKWCVATPRNPRPVVFATQRGQFLLILKREKPES